ncbi:MAG: type II secretion system protein [bacterium]
MKKAFTLIEMVLVLVIIGILMGVTMKFGSNRITDLKAQSLKDKFVDTYSEVQSQNLASSYHQQYRYTTLTLTFGSGIVATYDGSGAVQLFSDTQDMQIKNIV